MIGMVVHKRSVRPGGRAATRVRRYLTTKTSEAAWNARNRVRTTARSRWTMMDTAPSLLFSPVPARSLLYGLENAKWNNSHGPDSAPQMRVRSRLGACRRNPARAMRRVQLRGGARVGG